MEKLDCTFILMLFMTCSIVNCIYTDEFEYLKYSRTGTNDVEAEEIMSRRQSSMNSVNRRYQVLSQDLEWLIRKGIFGLENFKEGGKPLNVKSDLDCRIRYLAYQFSKKVLPAYANFQAVFDALQLGPLCGKEKPSVPQASYRGHLYKLGVIKRSGAQIREFFVDPLLGNDAQTGSVVSPFRKLHTAVMACREIERTLTQFYCIIYLRRGIHFLTESLKLEAGDSNIVITRYLEEDSVISAGTVIKPEWKLYKYDFEIYPLENSLFEGIKPGESTERVKYVGKFETESDCQKLCGQRAQCTSFTYFNVSAGIYANLCYHRVDGYWNPFYHTGVTSGKKVKVYVADLSGKPVKPFDQVFINNKRAVRARYPNGDPEITGLHTLPTGYVPAAASWLPPKRYPPATEIHVSDPSRTKTPFTNFLLGIGGPVSQFDPPKSYWGTAHPAGGGGATYTVPSGLGYSESLEMDRRVWSTPSTGIVHAFQHYHWGNWQFQVDGRDMDKRTLSWSYGGFQEARGNSDGKEWYVENVFEELDVANEWYLDPESMHLFYSPNGTELPSEIIVPQQDAVMSIIGSRDKPVQNIQLLGLTFAHTSITYLKKYEVPSGGDWAVHKNAMIFAEGVDGLLIDGCKFSAPGGNGLYLRGYVRNATVSNNEFFKLGDNGIVLVGTSELIDGTDGNQPLGVKILSNMVRDNGIWGKQTYAFVQAVTGGTYLEGNVCFNGPRAGMNFNDGFGGGNILTKNLLFNFVRETDDHGPINTWDRQPFLTRFLDGKTPSLMPMENKIYNNFIINNYRSVWPIDHDDGTCYWADSNNFLIYGGFKNYLGHSKQSMDNVYVYPDGLSHAGASFTVPFCADTAGQSTGESASGYGDVYINNICVLGKSDLYRLGSCNPTNLRDTIPYFANNKYYTPTGNATVNCAGNVWTLEQFQARGFDVGTTVSTLASSDQIIAWGKEKLGL